MAGADRDTDKEGAKPEPQAGGRGMALKLAAVAAGALLLGGGGTYAVLRTSAASEAPPAASAEAAGETGEAKPAPFSERLVTLEPFVVNITDEEYPRFLKVKVELEAVDAGSTAEIQSRVAQIRDAIIVLLTSKRLADVGDFEGKTLLKEEMVERVNGLFGEPRVRTVLFTEFVIQ